LGPRRTHQRRPYRSIGQSAFDDRCGKVHRDVWDTGPPGWSFHSVTHTLHLQMGINGRWGRRCWDCPYETGFRLAGIWRASVRRSADDEQTQAKRNHRLIFVCLVWRPFGGYQMPVICCLLYFGRCGRSQDRGLWSIAHWLIHFIRLSGWLRDSFALLITHLNNIDGIGQNW